SRTRGPAFAPLDPTRVRFAPSETALRLRRGIREWAPDAEEGFDMAEAYIVAAARTAGGRRGGRLAGWHPVDLAAQVLDALVTRSGIDPAGVEDVILGCVSQV